MPPTLTDLQDLRTVLGRLNAERPAGHAARPDQTPYEDRGGDFLRRLDLEVKTRQGKARILITGQIGVGKSSELWHYFDEKRTAKDSGFFVFCDLEKEEHPERCGATGVFLTIFRDCWSETRRFSYGRQTLSEVRNEILTRLIDWLKGQYAEDKTKVVFRFGGMDFPVFLNNPDKALALILAKAAQHEAVSEPSDRFGLVPDSLINLLNKLLNWITSQCGGRAPVLIVDHVDKIRDAGAAEDVLVKAAPQWGRISASIVMTAPFEQTLGRLRNSVESKWGKPLLLYPVEIPALEAGGGLPSIYKRIVKTSGLEPLIQSDGLHLLAHYSGGILRTFVQFLIQSCKEAHLARHSQLTATDARAVINEAERAYQDYSAQELDLLDEIAEKGTGLREAATLLRSPTGLLVVEPRRGEHALQIHPLARSSLERYRQKKKKEAV